MLALVVALHLRVSLGNLRSHEAVAHRPLDLISRNGPAAGQASSLG